MTTRLRDVKLFLVDLDGVVIKGHTLIPGAADAIALFRRAGAQLMFPTNNTTRSRGALASFLQTAGIDVPLGALITAAHCVAHYAVEKGWRRVYLIGERGLHEECVAAGLTVVDEAATTCDGVLVGLDRAFTYRKLATALTFLRRGATFVATNTDSSLPTEAGEIPGAAAMVASLEACSHMQPTTVIGKPNTPLLELALARSNQPLDACCVVGDRPETDIAMARNAGCYSILVLTGVANNPRREAYLPRQRPDLIAPSLLEVAHQYTHLSDP